jgi:hypothetical protein
MILSFEGPTRQQKVHHIRAIDFVGKGWTSTDVIARDMKLPKDVADRKLYHLTKGNNPEVELSRGNWWLKPRGRLVAAE